MSVLKKLAGDTALYGVSSILGRVLNYFLVPLHTSLVYGFPAKDFGIQSELYVYVAFLNVIYTYGMETAFFRFASKEQGNENSVYRLILSYILLSTVLFSSLFIFFAQPIADLLSYPDKADIIIWIALILAIDTVLAIPFAKLRQDKKAKKFAFAKTANIVLTVFLNIFFLVICKEIYSDRLFPFLKPFILLIYNPQLGIGYIFLSNLIANAFLFVLLYKEVLEFRFYFNWKKFRPILLYGYPLVFMGLAGVTNMMIDRLMIKYYMPDNFYLGKTSIEAMGIYAACLKLSIFMSLAIQAFRYAAEPFFFSQAQDKNAPVLLAKVMHYFIIACILIWLFVSLNIDIFKIIFLRSEEYWQGIIVVPVLLLANLFLGIYFNLSTWFKLLDKTYFGTYISFLGVFLTITLNLILIPVWGYMGCAVSTLITYFLMCAVCYYLGQKYYPVPYKIGISFIHLVIAGILIIIGFYWSQQMAGYSLLLNNVLLIIYFVFLWVTEKNKLTHLK